MTHTATSRRSRRARGRAWLVAYLLLTIAWPSLGPMPWVIDAALHEQVAANDEHAAHRHRDASDIPGSPTHPDDHNCFQCEVIKHLARCVPADGCFPAVAQFQAPSSPPPIRIGTTESLAPHK